MADPDGPPSQKGRGLSVPGQPTEEAVAEVGSAAGKSIIRGIERLGNAIAGPWIASREAKAEAARLAIETASKIETETSLTEARRKLEAAELEHQAVLQRRADRLRIELAREQVNLETIERRALEYTEREPANAKARELDDDWLFQFADLAQKVSEADVQNLWARALTSAAIEGAVKLSAVALQTLGLFDKSIAQDFKQFVSVVARIGLYPQAEKGQSAPLQIDLSALIDLGVVREFTVDKSIDVGDFTFEEARTGNLGLLLAQRHYTLTKRGADIANAVFRNLDDLQLDEDVERAYLLSILQQLMQQSSAKIFCKLSDGSRAIARVTAKSGVNDALGGGDAWKTSAEAGLMSPRLKGLLMAAEQMYVVEVAKLQPETGNG